jgi:hypothetical protein
MLVYSAAIQLTVVRQNLTTPNHPRRQSISCRRGRVRCPVRGPVALTAAALGALPGGRSGRGDWSFSIEQRDGGRILTRRRAPNLVGFDLISSGGYHTKGAEQTLQALSSRYRIGLS